MATAERVAAAWLPRPSGHGAGGVAGAGGRSLAGGLGLRLWGVRQGLPYAYNADEADHFVPQRGRRCSGTR